jgi:hypothetical protein
MIQTENLRKKVCTIINDISDKYHFTPIDGEFKERYFPNNLVFMSLSYLMDKNHLIIGEPGWGKTTCAQIVSTKFSGIPYDLYESLTVEGHPGLFTEKWKARPHYGELAGGLEKVIWQGSFGLDSFIVDEINRVSDDVQDEMLEGIRTGRWKYLNDVMYEGKKPCFFTMNYRDNGNGDIIPPLEDRIHIVTEEIANSPLEDYTSAEERVYKNLANPETTTEALESLKKMDFSGFKDIIKRSKQGDYLTLEEKKSIQESIRNISFTNDANYFLWTFASEINYTQKYGTKRASDPISDDDHDKNYAGINVKNSFSARPLMAARSYAQGLAWILGHSEVELDHVRYVLPYVSAHKLDFTEDFRSKHGNDYRGLNGRYEDLHLAKELVDFVHKNYETSVKKMRNMISDIQHGKVNKDKINIDDYDHPLIRHMIQKKVLEHKSNLL